MLEVSLDGVTTSACDVAVWVGAAWAEAFLLQLQCCHCLRSELLPFVSNTQAVK